MFRDIRTLNPSLNASKLGVGLRVLGLPGHIETLMLRLPYSEFVV